MLNEKIKVMRKNKAMTQEELAVRLPLDGFPITPGWSRKLRRLKPVNKTKGVVTSETTPFTVPD